MTVSVIVLRVKKINETVPEVLKLKGNDSKTNKKR